MGIIFIKCDFYFYFMEPLKIYFKRDIYDWYSYGKKWEMWPLNNKFSPINIFCGRDVILLKGRTGISRNGVIGEVKIGSLDKLLSQISYHKFAPHLDSEIEFRDLIKRLLKDSERYIAFEIKLD